MIPEKHSAPHNKGVKLPVEILTEEEVEALMGACSRRGLAGIRNRALIAVLYRAWLRIDEALSLRPSDVDLEQKTIRVRHGKGDKARVVGIPASVADQLQVWLDKRKALGIGPKKPVFCGITEGKELSNLGEPLDPSYFRHLFKRLAEKAGIEKRVHPHGFRHSGAVRALKKGSNVGLISRGLGHSSIAVTSTYLNHLSPEEVIASMQEE